ncbi:MAG TPA: flippase-like domain-containing protein [Nocardioides sp.]|nr:flippase-like domain-containing protein [Nocardioides sp.]
MLDAACLYVCLAAYQGQHVGPALVLTAYGFANLLGLLPLTPGGLGVVEGALIPLLIALGTSSSVAVLGVLTWRVLQFWLPVPVAAACYVGLRISGRRRAEPAPV